jgi:hypothetical protein
MRTETTSVKSSMKIAQTPVLIASHGSTCLSVLERCRGDRDRYSLSNRLTISRPLKAARHLTIDQHSAVIRKQLDWIVEAADRICADAFEIEIAFDEGGECAGQQHDSPNCLVRVSRREALLTAGPMTVKSRPVVGDPGPNRGVAL